jgi:hypothetical protein
MKSLVLRVVLVWFFRVAFKPYELFRQDVYAFVLFFTSSSFLMVGLNAALTYSRAVVHSMSRSGRLPIHTPSRYWARVSSGLPTARNDSHAGT